MVLKGCGGEGGWGKSKGAMDRRREKGETQQTNKSGTPEGKISMIAHLQKPQKSLYNFAERKTQQTKRTNAKNPSIPKSWHPQGFSGR